MLSINSIRATINVPNSKNCSQVIYIGITSPRGKATKEIDTSRVKGSNRHRYSVPPGLPLAGDSVFYFTEKVMFCQEKNEGIKPYTCIPARAVV